jgi:hypothetical protein
MRVVLNIIVLTIEMKTGRKYPTSENISKRNRKKRRRMRGRSKNIRRRRIKKRGRMKRKKEGEEEGEVGG